MITSLFLIEVGALFAGIVLVRRIGAGYLFRYILPWSFFLGVVYLTVQSLNIMV